MPTSNEEGRLPFVVVRNVDLQEKGVQRTFGPRSAREGANANIKSARARSGGIRRPICRNSDPRPDSATNMVVGRRCRGVCSCDGGLTTTGTRRPVDIVAPKLRFRRVIS
jgi:hypothetical protein